MKKLGIRILSIAFVLFLFLGGSSYLHNYAKNNIHFFFSDAVFSAHKGIPQDMCAVRATVAVEGAFKNPIILIHSRLIVKKKAVVSGPVFAWGSAVSVEKGGKLLADVFGMNSGVTVAKGAVRKGMVKKYSAQTFQAEKAVDFSMIKDQRIVRLVKRLRLVSFLLLYLFSFLSMFLLRQFLRVAYTVYAKPFWSMFSAVIGCVGLALLILSILTSRVGLSGLLILVLPVTLLFIEGYTAIAIVCGKFIRKHLHLPLAYVWFEVLLGLVFLWAITFIPQVGGTLFMLAALFGSGAALFSLFGFREV